MALVWLKFVRSSILQVDEMFGCTVTCFVSGAHEIVLSLAPSKVQQDDDAEIGFSFSGWTGE